MAQESIDNFIQIAKDYAKAEKELDVQRWVFISIERTDESGTNIRLFSYDLPREVYERRRWVIEWRKSKLVCQYPKGNVSVFHSYYDKRLGLNLFFDESTDADLQKAYEKLATKIANVQAAEERMKLKIKQIKEEKK